MSTKTCQRCGEEGEDRRTLWMACLYEMSELRVPFERVQLAGALFKRQAGTEELPYSKYKVPVYEASPEAKPSDHAFYTLLVCKECRGSWMGAIKAWFGSVERPEALGTGIFVRENGANVEVTEEEFWRRRGS